MSECIICKTEFYRQSEVEPAIYCLCNENATGTLWQWDRFRAYRKYIRYRVADFLYYLCCKLWKIKFQRS